MLVLVVFGSKEGGTAELAQLVGKMFAEDGWSVEIRPAADVTTVTGADAVVVGGALYFNRWHHDAVRFVRRHADQLRELPVWFFSSGPLDDSARSGDLAPVPQVQALAASIEIKGHMTFGGRLQANPHGFLARRMSKSAAGDWRDPQQVREWVHQICTTTCRRMRWSRRSAWRRTTCGTRSRSSGRPGRGRRHPESRPRRFVFRHRTWRESWGNVTRGERKITWNPPSMAAIGAAARRWSTCAR